MRRKFQKRLLIIVLVLFAVGGIRVQAMASDNLSGINPRSYASRQIQRGDTLWSIAEECIGSDDVKDIQECVEELKSINHIVNDRNLKAGAYLTVYYETSREYSAK